MHPLRRIRANDAGQNPLRCSRSFAFRWEPCFFFLFNPPRAFTLLRVAENSWRKFAIGKRNWETSEMFVSPIDRWSFEYRCEITGPPACEILRGHLKRKWIQPTFGYYTLAIRYCGVIRTEIIVRAFFFFQSKYGSFLVSQSEILRAYNSNIYSR